MNALNRILGPMARRISNLIARGTVAVVNAQSKMQTLQLRLLATEIKDGVEHFEPYGFTSHPHLGAEAVAAFVDGDRSHGIVVVVADRRYRLTGLAAGEVVLHDDQGQKVHLTRSGIVINGGGKPIIFRNTPHVRVEGTLTVTGDVQDHCEGGGKTMASMRNTFNAHTHDQQDQRLHPPTQRMGQ